MLSIAGPGLLANDSDADGDAIIASNFSAVSAQGGVVTMATDGRFTYTPPAGFVGTDSFTYSNFDGVALSADATVTITVIEGSPAAVADSFTMRPNQVLAVAGPGVLANDSDPNGDTITLSQFDQASARGGAVTMVANGSFTYTPPPGFTGTDTFTYRISDGVLFSNDATVTIQVVNAAPVAVADSFSVQEGRMLSIAGPGLLANDSDADGDAIIASNFSAVSAQGGVVTMVTDGRFTYTPPAGFVGTDSFTYRITDGVLESASVPVTVTVVTGGANTTIIPVSLPSGQSIPVRVANANLVAGSNLAVITNLGINPAGLTTLAELGVTANGSGLDFQLTVDNGASASLSAVLDLVAADLAPQLSGASGRPPARKLLYYAVNTTGVLSPLTYDPITGAGARFFDLNNDGTPDFFTLSLIDGSYGDKDGSVNGVIVDPSFAGIVDLTNLQFSNAGSGIVTISDPANAAPAAVNLRASLTGRPSSSNQIGYVVLHASEVASADSLLGDLNWLRGRARTLFSTLESSDVTLPAGSSFDRDLQLINGQSLRFFEVVDASLEELSSLSDGRFRLLSSPVFANGQVAFSSTSGVRFALSLLSGDPGLHALISTAQGLAPVLDLSAFTTAQNLSGTVALGREANFNSSAGFYRSLDAAGTVLAADGITRLRPGDSAYVAEALRSANLIAQLGGLAVGNQQTSSRSFSDVAGGSFLAPFAQVNGNTFFAYGAANTDGISHFRALGNNLFGLEDILGGGDRDFDDLVIGFTFTAIT